MVRFILVVVVLLNLVSAKAQLEIEHDTVYEAIILDYFEIVGDNSLMNTSSTTQYYKWVRNEIALESAWTTEICDPHQCYFHAVDSKNFFLRADSLGFMDVHLKTNNVNQGCGLVEIVITNRYDASEIYNLIYIFGCEFSGTQQLDISEFKVFPNPSKGMFNVANDDDKIKTIEVHGASGKLMKRVEVGDRELLDIMDLPRGSYILNLIGQDSKPLGSKLISKI